MTTNLLATVISLLVTNVSEVPHRSEPNPLASYGCLVIGCTADHSSHIKQIGKWVITNVVERRALFFEWEGERREIVADIPVSGSTNYFALVTTEKFEPTTNGPAMPGSRWLGSVSGSIYINATNWLSHSP